ncbi:MAG: PilZ domain-containing protein [Kangiellaceae bacterium]|nr:PilZ domain-containing protein [Kangiellaceae bacterium]
MKDERQGARAKIALPTTLIKGQHAYISETIDISESGVLIKKQPDLDFRLKVGDQVKAHIHGLMVASESKTMILTMQISRVEEQSIALTFVT